MKKKKLIPKQKTMDNQKVITGFLMLVITAISLTTASYAWFSNNTAVSVEGIDVNVTAAQGIQISTDAVNWKASISNADITDNAYTGNTNQFPAVLAPVSTIGSQAVGTFAMFDGALVEASTTTLTATAAAAEADGTSGNYVAFDIFIKSATTEDIWLNTGSGVVYDGATDVGLQYSARIAFFDQGTDATSTPATAIALASGTSGTQKFFEPNALTHTTYALANGATDGVKESYYGVKAIGTGLSLDPVDEASDTTHFSSVTTITPDTDTTPFEKIAGNVIFQVGAGITKVRVYIWMEGQDIDCENSVSLGTGVTATMNFVKVD